MIQLIVGNKGKGKTKHLLDKVNTEIRMLKEMLCILTRAESICSS